MFQGLRARMLAWLQANPQQCNEIMEEIIQDIGQAEGGGQKRLSNRQWVGLPGPGNVGRFVPDTELDRCVCARARVCVHMCMCVLRSACTCVFSFFGVHQAAKGHC